LEFSVSCNFDVSLDRRDESTVEEDVHLTASWNEGLGEPAPRSVYCGMLEVEDWRDGD
jgi:hypothetical protein